MTEERKEKGQKQLYTADTFDIHLHARAHTKHTVGFFVSQAKQEITFFHGV
jgi:hypothetical protein